MNIKWLVCKHISFDVKISYIFNTLGANGRKVGTKYCVVIIYVYTGDFENSHDSNNVVIIKKYTI